MRTSHTIALFFTALVGVILLIFGALFGKILHSDFVEQLEVKKTETVSSMSSVEEIRDNFENVVINNTDGSHFCKKGIFAEIDILPEHNQIILHKGQEFLITQQTLDTGEEVCSAHELNSVRGELQRWFKRYIYMSIFLLIISYGLGLIFAHIILGNVRKINEFSERFQPGKTTERIQIQGLTRNPQDEVRTLTNTLNTLFDRVNKHEKQLSQFSSDVAHEFKNALFEIRSSIQLSIKKGSECRCCEDYLKKISGLNELIDSLLFLAQIEHESICHTPKDLQESVKEVVHEHFLDKEDRIQLHMEESIQSVHIGLFQIALKNLIGNALKFSDTDKKVLVTLRKDSLKVEDSGVGIPEADIGNIWDRFYKTDLQRSHGSGHGLGLAITKEIIEQNHGWNIEVESTLKKGTTFTISFK